MNRHLIAAVSFSVTCVAFLCGSLLGTKPLLAVELMSVSTSQRLGLEEVWRRQMRVPMGADSIVNQQVVVHESDPEIYVQVVSEAKEGSKPQLFFRISVESMGLNGQPIGKEEAERLARREVTRLKRKYGDLRIESISVPRLRLYTAANNGTIDCRDAETGRALWMAQVGNARLNYGKMGIGDEFISITNGGNLIKVDATNGEPIRTIRTKSVPLFGALHSGKFSLVPTIANGIEGYPLPDVTADPFREVVSGYALAPPVKSPSSTKVAWATDRGFVYVMECSGEPSVMFRLDTTGIVSGIAAGDGDQFFFGSEGGQVYSVRATRTGIVQWNRPFGEAFYDPPFLYDGLVLITSAYGTLHALDQATGEEQWLRTVPNVAHVLGAFDGKIFVSLLTGSFATIDLQTGALIDVDDTLRPMHTLANRVSDRLYFVNSQGTVQCMRPIGKEIPTVRKSSRTAEDFEAAADADAEKSKESKPAGTTLDPFDTSDPFANPGGDADPFGGDGGMEDPFGGAGGGEDPFGGDPFGGG
ncbi:MAG: PQQ-binding-like beta-propeller repeat protein [Planctomycetota bacterium]